MRLAGLSSSRFQEDCAMSEKRRIHVCAAVVRDGSSTLLCQRPEGRDHAGCWEFPGGKRAEGESDAECLRREILEELGAEIHVLDLIWHMEHDYPGKSVSVRFYRAVHLQGVGGEGFVPLEGQHAEWVPTGELCSKGLLPADLPLAKFLRDGFFNDNSKCVRAIKGGVSALNS